MRARWPDDIAILQALAVEVDEIQRERIRELSVAIANKVGEMLEKGFKK